MRTTHKWNGCTDYLFAMPSFFSGVGRALDIGGQFDEYNWTDDPDENDAIAIFSDWRAVGLDLIQACSRFERELERDSG